MGKASKFFKSLFGVKPSDATHPPPPPPSHSYVDKQPKRRWSFIKSHKDKLHHHIPNDDPSHHRPRTTPLHHQPSDQTTTAVKTTRSTNHTIAVAPATAVFAEAAVAEAHAAAEVVRIATRATGRYGFHGEWAAIKIQSYFRGYLAKKALRALRALVKLQALVRGHILRKQAAIDMRRLQALLRVQARARAGRFQIADSPTKGPPTPEKFEHVLRTRKEKILETDTGKHHVMPPRRRNLFQPDNYSHSYSYSHSHSLSNSRGSTIHPPGLSPSESCEVNSVSTPYKEEVSFYVAQNSPTHGMMKVAGPFTPAKSDSSRSCVSGYSDHPNYMAYTESSRAKVRSLSAPRQRPQFELPSNIKRYSVYGYVPGPQRGSNMRDSFVSKAYPGSGRLDRLGMPVGGFDYRESEFSGSYLNFQQ